MIYKEKKSRLVILCFFLLASAPTIKAQIAENKEIKLSINDVIRLSKESNKLVNVFQEKVSASQVDLADAKMGTLPKVFTNFSYQRYTDVTLFEDVLGNSHSIPKPPNANSGGISLETSFNIYSGGRQKAIIRDAEYKNEIAAIDLKEQQANMSLQGVMQYLDMVKLYHQKKLIIDHKIRAITRLKNINAFYKNGKITKSDVLRADVSLSNIQLNEITNNNDYLISSQKLQTLLGMNIHTKIVLEDTTSLYRPEIGEVKMLLTDYSKAFLLLKADKGIQLQENRSKLTESVNFPSINLIAGYGLNYPNTLVFPPQPQTVGVGFLGVKATYDISSLYQNKNKVQASHIRENELKVQKEWVKDNLLQEVNALIVKYEEAINKMSVIEKSIEQAQINYDIQNAKYTNQLSLLTDLLEADNLLYEAKFNYIQANIVAISIYYRLLFITGKI